MYKRYIVRLTDEERGRIEKLVRHGRAHARSLLYARLLLKADASEGSPAWRPTREDRRGPSDQHRHVRPPEAALLVEDGLEVALMAKKPGKKPRRRVLDGRAKAHLVALTCSEPPEGRGSWTLRLLAERMVELGHIEGLSRETVRRTLKKTSFDPISSRSG